MSADCVIQTQKAREGLRKFTHTYLNKRQTCEQASNRLSNNGSNRGKTAERYRSNW